MKNVFYSLTDGKKNPGMRGNELEMSDFFCQEKFVKDISRQVVMNSFKHFSVYHFLVLFLPPSVLPQYHCLLFTIYMHDNPFYLPIITNLVWYDGKIRFNHVLLTNLRHSGL